MTGVKFNSGLFVREIQVWVGKTLRNTNHRRDKLTTPEGIQKGLQQSYF